MQFGLAMILFFVSNTSRRRFFVTGFSSIVHRQRGTSCNSRTVSKLSASFLEDLQQNLAKSFSSMASSNNNKDSKYFTVGITGANGLVGTALCNELGRRDSVNGKPVRIVKLSRGDRAEQKELSDEPSSSSSSSSTTTTTSLVWNPNASSPQDVIDPSALAEMDAIVHLAGENVATGLGPLGFLGLRPWTNEKKQEILNSRVIPTKALASAIGASPKPMSFLVASGVGVYGDNFVGDEMQPVDESMDVRSTRGFLAQVSREWEAATKEAATGSSNNNKNNRVVNMRFGVVLSTKGGALAKLYPIFFLGGGGNVGSGNQYFSFISARDHARAMVHTLETKSLKGPVNFCSPEPCTNAEFTKALGKVLGRPTLLPFPSFAVSALFGEMGQEMLLGGVRALPTKLLRSGFEFQHPTIEQALQSAMEEDI